MCGIAGVWEFRQPADLKLLARMTDVMSHRGPDGEGHWLHPKGQLALGHRRLSIIDLSEHGTQPMHYLKGRLSLTFNGEIYNYIELKQELIKDGYTFDTHTDSEVIMAAYLKWGKACVSHFDGMFAFALWDDLTQELWLARDRFGEKPLFYTIDENRIVFASEIKALWAYGIPKKVRPEAVYSYLLFGSIEHKDHLDLSFFQDVYKLEPAHHLTVKEYRVLQKKRYWDVSTKSQAIELEDAQTEFYRLLSQSVSRRLRSDVAVGSSLSGGLDSSSIVCLIDQIKAQGQIQKTFSARFPGFSKDEGIHIDKVLRQTKNAQGISVFPDEDSMINNWHRIVYHQDEPFGSLSIAAQFEVMQLAKMNHVTVLLDGQGADESLAGYRFYYKTYYSELQKSNKHLYRQEQNAFAELFGTPFDEIDLKTRIRQQAPVLFRKMAQLKRQLLPISDPYFAGIDTEMVRNYRHLQVPIEQFENLKDHLYHSSFKQGLSELLRYADRNSMAHSVEVRLPFLSHELVEFIFSLPSEMLIRNGWSKYILRHAMQHTIPSEIAWRKDKIGYEPPQSKIMNHPFFQKEIVESRTKLLDLKVIHKAYDVADWRYLMLAKYM